MTYDIASRSVLVAMNADPLTEVLGSRIRVARRKAGLSQVALARAVGATHRTVVRWEKGHSVPSSAFRQKIVEATGADVFESGDDDEESG